MSFEPSVSDPPPPAAAPATGAAPEAAAPSPVSDPADDSLLFGRGEEKRPPAPVPREVQVVSAVPLALDATHLSLDVAGRGRSRLALERIDAVAVAGVKGISGSGKAVLLLDLALNWTGADDLQVVRLRSDGFDPRAMVGAEGSPLQALRSFAARLVSGARAVPLPEGAEPDAPFRIFPDLDSYQAEVLGARAKR